MVAHSVSVFQATGKLYRLHLGEIYYDRQWTVTYYGKHRRFICYHGGLTQSIISAVDGRPTGCATAPRKDTAKELAARAALRWLGVQTTL